jgi:hypothetical protein
MGKSMIFFAVLAIAIMPSIMVFAQDINSTQNKPISGAHKDSGKVTSAFPDVCKTPSTPAGPIPVPYPNTAMSSDTKEGSKKVKMDGNPTMLKESNFSKSTGDEKGTANIVSPQHKQHTGYFMQMRRQRSPASPARQMMLAAPEQIMRPEEPLQQMQPVAPMKDWIEIELKDEVIKQMPSERFEIKLPDGKVRKGSIDSQGKAKIGEIKPAKTHVSFPEDTGKRLEQQQ